MDAKIAKLPAWARNYIERLRLDLKIRTEQMAKELAQLRPQVALFKKRNLALRELLDAASKGGHITAYEIVDVLNGYGLELKKEDE